MKIIYRYLIRNFLGPFVLTFFVALFILLMQYLWKYVDELVGKGLEISLVLKMLSYAGATLVTMALPLAVLLSSLMTFGNMGERYEIVALKSAGISINKMMLPLALLSLLITVFAFWYSNTVVPYANVKLKMLLYDIREQKPALSIEEGTFYNGFDNYTIRIGKKHSDNETIEDILIYDHSSKQGNTTMTYAKRGTMRMSHDKNYLLFTMNDGFFWDEKNNNNGRGDNLPLTRSYFKEQYKRFDLSSFQLQKSDESFFKNMHQSMPVQELVKQIDTMKIEIGQYEKTASTSFCSNLYYFNNVIFYDSTFDKTMYDTFSYYRNVTPEILGKMYDMADQNVNSYANTSAFSFNDISFKKISLWAYEIEYHRKFTLSLACFLFFFIGASLGSIIRKGGIGIPLVLTVLIFSFYFVLSTIGEKMAKGAVVPTYVGMWFSTFLITPLCIFLTYKANIDSAVLSWDSYGKFFAKIKSFHLFKRHRHENPSTLS